MSVNDETRVLRNAALQIFAEALSSVDPGSALRGAVSMRGSNLQIYETTLDLDKGFHSIYSVAVGKAAWPMACALQGILQDRLTAGVLSGPAPTALPSWGFFSRAEAPQSEKEKWPLRAERWQVFAGGHPLPNQQSLNAAAAAFELLKRAEAERALILFLISGGGSAMLEWPTNEAVTLNDLRRANQILVESGLSINEINVVRRSFSAIKGNKLAMLAPQARQLTLIVSDTNEGQDATVASGPTLPPQSDSPSPSEIINRYDLSREAAEERGWQVYLDGEE